MARPIVRAEAIRLRVDERLSLREIQRKTGASKSVISLWLRPYARTAQEKKRKPLDRSGAQQSKYHAALAGRVATRAEKARIAEAAVLFRLVLHGFDVAKPAFDGARADWIATSTAYRRSVRLQVKTLHRLRSGTLLLSLRYNARRNRYSKKEIDFIVGYDLYSDTAYVMSMRDVAGRKSAIGVQECAAERWDKLKKQA